MEEREKRWRREGGKEGERGGVGRNGAYNLKVRVKEMRKKEAVEGQRERCERVKIKQLQHHSDAVIKRM